MSQPPNLNRQDYGIQDFFLQYISSNFVSVKDADKKFYKFHLEHVIRTLIDKMKEVDPFFGTMFQRDSVAGSFWDGLKIGKPVEFDKNFVLKLPSCLANKIEFVPASPSFVVVNVRNGLKDLKKSDKWELYRKIEHWLDRDENIISDKVRFWMESVIVKAIDSFPEWNKTTYKLSCKKAGPAMTVKVELYPENKHFDIDIVPAFEFQLSAWPKHVRKYPADVSPALTWHLVPKPIHSDENKSHVEHGEKYPPSVQWRMSFHNQESARIYNKSHLKAVLKLIKKMRDVKLDSKLLWSYAIKTVFLWEMDNQDDDFWRKGLSVSFLHMLHVLNVILKSGKLPFYWQKDHDLLEKLKESQREQLSCRVQNICKQIYYGLENQDWFVIAREILTAEEFSQLQRDIIVEESNNKVVARLVNGDK